VRAGSLLVEEDDITEATLTRSCVADTDGAGEDEDSDEEDTLDTASLAADDDDDLWNPRMSLYRFFCQNYLHQRMGAFPDSPDYA
jgi:hypothetical protein